MKKVNLNDIPWIERKSPKGDYHRFRRDVALAFRSAKTGPKLPPGVPFEVELIRMPPGAKNFPFHSHAAEWEFYLIISGTGKVRAGKVTRSLKPGDCVMNPPGEPHQINNTGREDLLYYVIANNAPADFYHYPDSNKWGVSWDDPPTFRMKAADYYEGEE
ncbi:MAG: cupin domain-containing protein [Verrucomicrobia bacterium]|nr:cupin domain-containing protein [Verrucomicrobiota bacterium]